jgi:hypothetical protein
LKLARPPQSYPETTYASPFWIVRWPHRRRYEMAITHLLSAHPARVLDYGAGDGHVLVTAVERGLSSELIVGYEPVPSYADMLREKLDDAGQQGKVDVVTDLAELEGQFDYIACHGVLEHMPLLERQRFFDTCETHLAPGGMVFIDVPVEVGPALFVKNLGRRLLKGRDPEYSWRDLIAYGFGKTMFDPGRFDASDRGTWIQEHRGFDYRLLREELAHRFVVRSEFRTPVGFLPAPLGNQEIFFECTRGERRTERQWTVPR